VLPAVGRQWAVVPRGRINALLVGFATPRYVGLAGVGGHQILQQFRAPGPVRGRVSGPGRLVSEGWISVAPNACQTDSKHADLTEFYWRGETDWIKTKGGRTQWSWGKDRQFSVKDGSFAFKIPIKSSRALTSLAS